MATGIGNSKNKRIRCLGSMKLVATGIENKKNKSFRCNRICDWEPR